MERKVSASLRLRDVGLSHGAASRVAGVCKRSPTYVWKVAVGQLRGTETIRRHLVKRGWRDPRTPAEAVA